MPIPPLLLAAALLAVADVPPPRTPPPVEARTELVRFGGTLEEALALAAREERLLFLEFWKGS